MSTNSKITLPTSLECDQLLFCKAL